MKQRSWPSNVSLVSFMCCSVPCFSVCLVSHKIRNASWDLHQNVCVCGAIQFHAERGCAAAYAWVWLQVCASVMVFASIIWEKGPPTVFSATASKKINHTIKISSHSGTNLQHRLYALLMKDRTSESWWDLTAVAAFRHSKLQHFCSRALHEREEENKRENFPDYSVGEKSVFTLISWWLAQHPQKY